MSYYIYIYDKKYKNVNITYTNDYYFLLKFFIEYVIKEKLNFLNNYKYVIFII